MLIGCQCGGQCGRRGMSGTRPRGFLGFLSAAAVVSTAPAATSSSTATDPVAITASLCAGSSGCNPTFIQTCQQAIAARFLPAYTTATGASNANACAGVSTNSETTALNVGKTVASSALNVASIGASIAGAAVSAIPIIGSIISGITSIISVIVGHHSAAVKEQDTLLCQVVPATNSLLQQIDSALAAGSITPAQAEAQYSSFLSQFMSELKTDSSYKTGDALWGYGLMLQGIITARNQDLANGLLTGGAPGPWTQTAATGTVSSVLDSIESALGISGSSSTTSGTSTATTTNYLPWLIAAGVAALFLL